MAYQSNSPTHACSVHFQFTLSRNREAGRPQTVRAFVSDARRPGPEGTPNRPQVTNLPHKRQVELEVQLQRQLEDPPRTVDGRDDVPEVGVADVGLRVGEDHVVEDLERLRPEG